MTDSSRQFIIGVDLGGTKIEALALGDDGAALHRERLPTPRHDYDGTLAAIAELRQALDGCFVLAELEPRDGVVMPHAADAEPELLEGRLGTLDLAAHQLVIGIASFTFTVAVGVASHAPPRDRDRAEGLVRGTQLLQRARFGREPVYGAAGEEVDVPAVGPAADDVAEQSGRTAQPQHEPGYG